MIMFGLDKKDDDKDEEIVQPVSTQPVNEGLMGVNDDADDSSSADDTSSSSDDTDTDEVNTENTNLDGHPDDETMDDTASAPILNVDSHTDNTPTANTDELLDIKREALQDLSPLVGHLDQTPEEKFKTTMMMIQASDNQALIPDAYAAAKEITDEKTRAQALLDIINEINYFTQKKD